MCFKSSTASCCSSSPIRWAHNEACALEVVFLPVTWVCGWPFCLLLSSFSLNEGAFKMGGQAHMARPFSRLCLLAHSSSNNSLYFPPPSSLVLKIDIRQQNSAGGSTNKQYPKSGMGRTSVSLIELSLASNTKVA